jgi:hypothetical protein
MNDYTYSQTEESDTDSVLTEKLFSEQNAVEDRIANNMLKINLGLYIATLIIIILIVAWFKFFFYIHPINKNTTRLQFSALEFHYDNKENPNKIISVTKSLSCVLDNKCTNNCELDMKSITAEFNLYCGIYNQARIAGLIVSTL